MLFNDRFVVLILSYKVKQYNTLYINTENNVAMIIDTIE